MLSKTSITNKYWNYKKCCRGERKTYADELEYQKKELVLEMFMPPPMLNIKPSKLEQLLQLIGQAGVIEFHNSVDKILEQSANPTGFFVSPQLLDCPFIYIWASLMAADIFFYPDNEPERSLFTDFEIMASLLPYVNILATDSYISQLIRSSKLLNRFNTHIFTVKQRKSLVSKLRSL
jgi:hypothetical protein